MGVGVGVGRKDWETRRDDPTPPPVLDPHGQLMGGRGLQASQFGVEGEGWRAVSKPPTPASHPSFRALPSPPTQWRPQTWCLVGTQNPQPLRSPPFNLSLSLSPCHLPPNSPPPTPAVLLARTLAEVSRWGWRGGSQEL